MLQFKLAEAGRARHFADFGENGDLSLENFAERVGGKAPKSENG
jgi:hypothetical protein